MDTQTIILTYNKIMSIYDVQRAYQAATSRKETRGNLQRAIRLQDMALRAAGANGEFLTKPLENLTRKEKKFLDTFNTNIR